VSAGGGRGSRPRLGAIVPVLNPDISSQQLVDLAVRAEQLGFDGVYMPEAWARDALILCQAFASATSTIEIGTAAVSLPVRTPAVVAMASATIDDLSGGRFTLGLGMGHQRTTTKLHGLEYAPKLQLMREYVEIVRRLHRREQMDFQGELLRSTDYRLGFQPRRERLPIYIAVLRLGAMRLAGEIADGMFMYFAPPAYVRKGIAAAEEGLALAGRDPASFDRTLMVPTWVTDDPARAREVARVQVAWYANLAFYNTMFREAGFAEDADRLRDAWAKVKEGDPEMKAWGAISDCGTAELVSDELVDSVAVFGSAAHCRERFEAYRELGVDTPIVFPYGVYGSADEAYAGYARTLEAFAR
jgi:5,10-methylenetetrahydromethanopterin reductase